MAKSLELRNLDSSKTNLPPRFWQGLFLLRKLAQPKDHEDHYTHQWSEHEDVSRLWKFEDQSQHDSTTMTHWIDHKTFRGTAVSLKMTVNVFLFTATNRHHDSQPLHYGIDKTSFITTLPVLWLSQTIWTSVIKSKFLPNTCHLTKMMPLCLRISRCRSRPDERTTSQLNFQLYQQHNNAIHAQTDEEDALDSIINIVAFRRNAQFQSILASWCFHVERWTIKQKYYEFCFSATLTSHISRRWCSWLVLIITRLSMRSIMLACSFSLAT